MNRAKKIIRYKPFWLLIIVFAFLFLHFTPAYTEYGYDYNQPQEYCSIVTFGAYKALSDVKTSLNARLVLGQSLKKDILEPLVTEFEPYYPTIVKNSKGCGILTKYQYFIL